MHVPPRPHTLDHLAHITHTPSPHTTHTGDLKDVAKAVAGVELSDHLVDVVITLFDEDSEYSPNIRKYPSNNP